MMFSTWMFEGDAYPWIKLWPLNLAFKTRHSEGSLSATDWAVTMVHMLLRVLFALLALTACASPSIPKRTANSAQNQEQDKLNPLGKLLFVPLGTLMSNSPGGKATIPIVGTPALVIETGNNNQVRVITAAGHVGWILRGTHELHSTALKIGGPRPFVGTDRYRTPASTQRAREVIMDTSKPLNFLRASSELNSPLTSVGYLESILLPSLHLSDGKVRGWISSSEVLTRLQVCQNPLEETEGVILGPFLNCSPNVNPADTIPTDKFTYSDQDGEIIALAQTIKRYGQPEAPTNIVRFPSLPVLGLTKNGSLLIESRPLYLASPSGSHNYIRSAHQIDIDSDGHVEIVLEVQENSSHGEDIFLYFIRTGPNGEAFSAILLGSDNGEEPLSAITHGNWKQDGACINIVNTTEGSKDDRTKTTKLETTICLENGQFVTR